MTTVSGDARRLQHVLQLVRAALDLDDDTARAAWLARECGDDALLRAEVERLVDADRAADGPLDTPLSAQLAGDDTMADPRLGRQVGAFVLRELLGRGGMGAVYRAERVEGGFLQTVALKLLRAADGDDAEALRRFAQERQILVRLRHPHIAQLVDGGVTAEGQPWYAMELVEGETLVRYVQHHQLSLRERIGLLLQVCDAVHHAHRNLVLHRDLKPANILVDTHGRARLLDFGIAKLLHAGDGHAAATQTGHHAFTPGYAAPEQVRGDAVSTATDIYALGVIAFELFTGHRPFRRSGIAALGSTADGTDPAAPSRVLAREGGDPRRASALRGDLDTIVLACLQPDPARRYASVEALKRDLERHLAGLPIEARPASPGYRVSRFVRRHRVGVALGALAIAALLGAAVVSMVLAGRAARESARATALAASLQGERDAVLDEIRRQELLREHFVVVLHRATLDGEPIAADGLLALAADPQLLGDFGDEHTRLALQVALSELFLQRGDYIGTLRLLDGIDAGLALVPGRSQAVAAATRADASIRLGRLDEAEAALALADRLMTPGQRAGGSLPAHLAMLRAQVQRARGDTADAIALTREAVVQALAATDTSPLQRGLSVGSAATAMLQAGELDAAIDYAGQADAIWREARVSANGSSATVATQRANALFLRGDLLAAKALVDVVDREGEGLESPPARAARDATHAKLLALLARPDEAVRRLDSAVKGMCAATGDAGLDCLRVRMSGVDTLQLAGRAAQARQELDALRPMIEAYPPLLATQAGFDRMLALRLAPGEITLAAVLDSVPAIPPGSGLARRNAVRSLLMLAEAMRADGHADYARRLAQAAIDTAADELDGNGMDRSLLALWKSELDGVGSQPEDLAVLADAVGAMHPMVASRRAPHQRRCGPGRGPRPGAAQAL